jgi:alcohol dehydrogenase class IV
LLTAYHHPDDLDARTDMCLASLLSGMALANAGLGAVHGIAGPLGGMCEAPHGVACARLLPPVMGANVLALTKRHPDSLILPRFQEAARLLTGSAAADAQDGVRWLAHLCTELKIPLLSECGFTQNQIPQLVEQARKASSMKGNPVELTSRELEKNITSAC